MHIDQDKTFCIDIVAGLLRSLQHLGMDHVMKQYLQGLDADSAGAVSDFQYEAAWQSANWTLDTPARSVALFISCISLWLIQTKSFHFQGHFVEKKGTKKKWKNCQVSRMQLGLQAHCIF